MDFITKTNMLEPLGIVLPHGFKLPECNHPIEKWCENCDFDYDTYERIPHFRKYKEIYMWTEEEFEKEMGIGGEHA